MKKMYVLIGNYGSGKTELALNFAFKAAERGEHTELIDLDMVNTFFRLTERGRLARLREIRVVSPNYACSGIESLSVPAEVQSAFAMDWDTVVFDVGGDAVGSTALGRYHQDFMELEDGALEVLNVVNIRRPLAGTVEKIMHLQEEMQIHGRLKITGMINNTNLAQMTTPAELHLRQKGAARAVSRRGARPQVHRHADADRHLYAARLGQLGQGARRPERAGPVRVGRRLTTSNETRSLPLPRFA